MLSPATFIYDDLLSLFHRKEMDNKKNRSKIIARLKSSEDKIISNDSFGTKIFTKTIKWI